MNLAQRVLVGWLRFYQMLVSPLWVAFVGPAGRCRYTPSCSQYAREAIARHGAGAGGAMAIKRLCRCHPWAGFGEDPVPIHKARFMGLVGTTGCIRHILKSPNRHGS